MKGINNQASQLERESSYELLRIISQFYIVFYHILLLFVYPETGNIIYKALWLPLHVGVIIFVLISGFFTIKPTSKGLWKLLAIFFIYSLPELLYNITHACNLKDVIKSLLFLSNTHFWFIKTYLFLYLLSPLINKYLKSSTLRQQWYIIIALVFISQYMAFTNGDTNMKDGKNVVNFIFIYSVGYMLKQYKYKWIKLNFIQIAVVYLILNILVTSLYFSFYNSAIGYYIWELFFPYSSPGLLINSILVFILIGQLPLHSKLINYAAGSSLAIYLIHANRPYLAGLLGKGSIFILCQTNANTFMTIIALILFTVFSIFICIFIDKILSPLWKKINIIGIKIYTQLGY